MGMGDPLSCSFERFHGLLLLLLYYLPGVYWPSPGMDGDCNKKWLVAGTSKYACFISSPSCYIPLYCVVFENLLSARCSK